MRGNISSNVKATGKLRDTETVMRSLGEGCWKSTKIGNSLAAYPASRWVSDGRGKLETATSTLIGCHEIKETTVISYNYLKPQ